MYQHWETGAYCLRNKVNGKVYVGGAYVSLKKRKQDHEQLLRKGKHFNCHLQSAWNKYGAEAFSFHILERCVHWKVKRVEQKWISYYRASDRKYGYNKSPTAGSPLGYKHSDEVKAQRSVAMKNSLAAIEQRKRLAALLKGRTLPDEVKKRIAASHVGICQPEGARAKISAAQKGHVMPEHVKSMLVQRMQGNNYGKALKGRQHDLARREVQSNAMRGNQNGKGTAGKRKKRVTLVESQQTEVRDLYASGNYSQPELATRFNVDCSTIGKIVRKTKGDS